MIQKTACGPNFSLCYTELGILYAWGMIKNDDFEAIEWSPTFFNVSLPKDNLTEEDLYEFHLTDIKATMRSIFACDSKGR
jgi:alpha-tubulin suppressor-like RCC1 family protein